MSATINKASGCLIASVVLGGIIVGVMLVLRGGVWLGNQVLPWLLRLAAINLAVVLVVLLPLAMAWRTRRHAARGLIYSSTLFGITLWVLGLTLTYELWGGGAVLIGLVLLGVGVVPMAMVAALLQEMWASLGQLVLLGLLTYATRRLGRHLLAELKKREQNVYELEVVEE